MTNSEPDLTIITATCRRPHLLALLLDQVQRQQDVQGCFEHLVISDGPDPTARALLRGTRAAYHELPQHTGNFGAACKDYGLSLARGQYVCFWDDDNLYESHALATLQKAAAGVEIGVVRARHWSIGRQKFVVLPRRWGGTFRPGDIDTMCVCVHTDLARRANWHAPPHGRGTDHRWLTRLEAFQPSLRYFPVSIGAHLAFPTQ